MGSALQPLLALDLLTVDKRLASQLTIFAAGLVVGALAATLLTVFIL